MNRYTQARIQLKRTGNAQGTKEVLQFQYAHARARDAVHAPWNHALLANQLKKMGDLSLYAESKATHRQDYLKFPNQGRELKKLTGVKLPRIKHKNLDIAIIVSDGLSSRAIDQHFIGFWKGLRKKLKELNLNYQIVLAPFGRVAIGDPIGFQLKATMSIVILGERPGLSSADSLGAYFTYKPKSGRMDSERNCLSNIRPPNGMSYDEASLKAVHFILESLRLKVSGVSIKEPQIDYIEKTKFSPE